MSKTRAVHHFVSPVVAVNVGLWMLFAGASAFLGFRLWLKMTRRHGLWWDDYILIVCWLNLLATNALISYEMANGYVTKTWGDRMLMLITISSCGTTIGQTWSKTAFAATLLRITNTWQKAVLWFCIVTLNIFLVLKVFVNWSKYCGLPKYQNYWRMDGFCIDYEATQDIKTSGNIYNIIMDFVLALFPWMVIWKLNISRLEKIGLCVTMSLGMLVAIISAVRTAWMEDKSNSTYDDWYFWKQGLSMVWYSAEVTGTIMVQCIPVMRPLIRELKTQYTSKRLTDSEEGRASMAIRRSTRVSNGTYSYNIHGGGDNRMLNDLLGKSPRIRKDIETTVSMSPSEIDYAIQASHTAPLRVSWPLPER
ncbi:hypothetical protein BJ170DRAFT_376870 [Xylariales sp. AK1849]|nr:hypothetical protein BJ170DRAFT_376870 [Xylariales sp. AK1849]